MSRTTDASGRGRAEATQSYFVRDDVIWFVMKIDSAVRKQRSESDVQISGNSISVLVVRNFNGVLKYGLSCTLMSWTQA